jgi:hypothetical protein
MNVSATAEITPSRKTAKSCGGTKLREKNEEHTVVLFIARSFLQLFLDFFWRDYGGSKLQSVWSFRETMGQFVS